MISRRHRLTDHTSYGQPVLVDPTTIERIEVVRGSSSVVSGSSAIGGVINIITKKGAPEPFSFSATAGFVSATRRPLRYGNGCDIRDGGSPGFAGRIGLRKDWHWDRVTGSPDLFVTKKF